MNGYQKAIAEASAERLREEVIALRGDLDESRAKLAELREMERERNAYKHAFDRLASHVLNAILPSDETADVESMISDCTKTLERLRRGHSFAKELAAMARAYEKKAP